jgi:glycosyltransferase involved in cell wall biosynthesis
VIESPDFWDGFDVERGGDDWLETASLVVLPAFVEHRPRRLLAAAASAVPVIASHECGVGRVDGGGHVPSGDADALRAAIAAALK